MSGTAWLTAYTDAMRRTPPTKKAAGVPACAVCCTLFSLVGALFLFIVGGLINSHYPYMHIPGNTAQLSQATIYGGVIYLLLALISVGFWIKGAYRAGILSRGGQFQQVR